jgi:putative transposase
MGRPTVPAKIRTLIRTMAYTNPRSGAPRIHGELLKLGIDVCQATVAKCMGHPRQPPSQTWRTFLTNHIGQIVAADFFVVPTVTYRLVFVLVLLAHDRRRIAEHRFCCNNKSPFGSPVRGPDTLTSSLPSPSLPSPRA